MNLNEIVYLKNILGEKEAECFIQADEEKLKMLVKVLKRTSLKRILPSK